MRLKNRDKEKRHFGIFHRNDSGAEPTVERGHSISSFKAKRLVAICSTVVIGGLAAFAMSAFAAGDTVDSSNYEIGPNDKLSATLVKASMSDDSEDNLSFADLVAIGTTTASTTSSTSTSTSTTTTTSSTTTTAVTTTTETVTEAEAEEVYEEELEEPAVEESYYEGSGYEVSDYEIVMLARTVAQEAGSCSYAQQACVVWTVLNRVDSERWPNTIAEVVTEPDQFAYYPDRKYDESHYQVAYDQVYNWINGGERYLDPVYIGFWGDNVRNHFYNYEKTLSYCPD